MFVLQNFEFDSKNGDDYIPVLSLSCAPWSGLARQTYNNDDQQFWLFVGPLKQLLCEKADKSQTSFDYNSHLLLLHLLDLTMKQG